MTTILATSNLNNPELEARSIAWEKSGSKPEERDQLLKQESLLKKLGDIANLNLSPMSSPRETDNSPSQIQAVQLPSTPVAEIKKGKVQKAKKEIKCCNNALLIASHFPFFGPISSNCSKILIAKKIKKTAETDKISKLNERHKQYNIASLVSTLVTLALAVTAVVVGIFSGIGLILGLSVLGAAVLLTIPVVTLDSIQLHRHKHPTLPEAIVAKVK